MLEYSKCIDEAQLIAEASQVGREPKPLLCMVLLATRGEGWSQAGEILRQRIDPKIHYHRFLSLQASLRNILEKKAVPVNKESRPYIYDTKSIVKLMNDDAILKARAVLCFRFVATVTLMPEPILKSDPTSIQKAMESVEFLSTSSLRQLVDALLNRGEHELADVIRGIGIDDRTKILEHYFGKSHNTRQKLIEAEAFQWFSNQSYMDSGSMTAPDLDWVGSQFSIGARAKTLFKIQGQELLPRFQRRRFKPNTISRKHNMKRFGLVALTLITLGAASAYNWLDAEWIFEKLRSEARQEVTTLEMRADLASQDLSLAENQKTYYAFGWANYNLGRYDQAEEMMKRLLSEPSLPLIDQARCHYILGSAHLSRHRFEDATLAFNQAESLYKAEGSQRGVEAVRLERVSLMIRTEELTSARELLEKLFAETEPGPRHYKLAADLHFELGNFIESLKAAEAWESVETSHAEHLLARSHQAYCLIAMGDVTEGERMSLEVKSLATNMGDPVVHVFNQVNFVALGLARGLDMSDIRKELVAYAYEQKNMDLLRQLDTIHKHFERNIF